MTVSYDALGASTRRMRHVINAARDTSAPRLPIFVHRVSEAEEAEKGGNEFTSAP